MPEGIIRDPKQNPKERNYGIVYVPDEDSNKPGKHYKYVKGAEDFTRFYHAGEPVWVEDVNDVDTKETENGIVIHGWATVTGYSPNAEKAPVIERIIKPLNEHQRRAAIRAAWNHMESDFTNPPS